MNYFYSKWITSILSHDESRMERLAEWYVLKKVDWPNRTKGRKLNGRNGRSANYRLQKRTTEKMSGTSGRIILVILPILRLLVKFLPVHPIRPIVIRANSTFRIRPIVFRRIGISTTGLHGLAALSLMQ